MLSSPPAAFAKAAGALSTLLQTIRRTGDATLLRGLIEQHATRVDPVLRDEIATRLWAAGLPTRVAALPPVLRPFVRDGVPVDAAAEPVSDLDAAILEEWADF